MDDQIRGRIMKFFEDIEVKTNLKLIARERGKIVARRESHNIFLDLGREWLSNLIAYDDYGPPEVYQRDDRIRYMGFGIGGTQQVAPGVANASPIGGSGDPYESNSASGIGANSQTDVDRTVTRLERPVRVSGGSSNYPGVGTDRWIGQIIAPVDHNTGTSATFVRVFTQEEISYLPFTSVPLSEAMLYTSLANPAFYLNTGVAYDTFPTLSKTTAISIEVEWTFNF
jgi:hypothetical protein